MEDTEEKPNGLAFTPGFQVRGSRPTPMKYPEPALTQPTLIEVTPEKLLRAGFNGRYNKVADTCYAWWVGGSLGILNRPHLQDFNATERYLLDKTQHHIGGFSKMPGDPPGQYLLALLVRFEHPSDCVECMRAFPTDDNGAMTLDIMHSSLGLAALAVMKHCELRSIDSRLCMSISAREHFEQSTALGRGEMTEDAKIAGET